MFKEINSNLDEILKCVICFEKLSDAKMCPYCSKLFCKVCIRKWLTESRLECPHCRASLRLESVITCRFVKEINQALESLSLVKPDHIEKCSSHDCPLNYYCVTCNLAICSDCAMFASEHKGHDFKHLSAVYSQHMQLIELETGSLRQRVAELELVRSEIDKKIEKITVVSNDKNKELSSFIELARIKLDEQLNQRLSVLIKKKKNILKEIEKLECLQDEIERETGLTAKSRLISISSELVKKLKNVQGLNTEIFEVNSMSYDFDSEIIPPYEISSFVLRNYTSAKVTSEVSYSENLEYNGLIWRLKVYPNGNGVAKNNYLSVFLELVKSYGGSAKYDYKVEMINFNDPNRTVQREFSSDFEQGECWGYNRFYRIDLLKDEGYLDEQDSLHMKFYIRAPSYYQLAKDQANFIKVLKENEENSKKKFREIVDRIENFEDRSGNLPDEEIRLAGFIVSTEEVSSDSEEPGGNGESDADCSDLGNSDRWKCDSEEFDKASCDLGY